MSLESAAASIIQRAVQLDHTKRYTESLICYQEGIQILMESLKKSPEPMKQYLRTKIEEYMSRAEQIKTTVDRLKDEGKYHETINIGDGDTGYGYRTVFGRFLDSEVSHVAIEDPYVRHFHQLQNFVRFCELLLKKCKNLRGINVVTIKVEKREQDSCFAELSRDLRKRNVTLRVQYSSTLHDRQIILSSGWVIKIGRGLDYFKPPESKFSIGIFDLDLRACHETIVDICHLKNIKTS